MKVVATTAFAGDPQSFQLSFPQGAEIQTDPNDSSHPATNGWMYGVYQGQPGWFPSSHVAVLASSSSGINHNAGSAPVFAQAMAVPHENNIPVATAVPVAASAPPMTAPPANAATPPQFAPLPQHARRMTEDQILELMDQGYTRGLAESLGDTKRAFAKRHWLVDNSGSMQATDGHRMVETKNRNHVKFVDCSRWEEISECVSYHIQMAALLGAPTCFRLLNDPGAHVGPQVWEIDTSSSNTKDKSHVVEHGMQTMRKARPGGCTPLTDHILAIQSELQIMAPTLRQNGQRVALIIATDGLPTDDRGYGGKEHQQQFVEALRTLEGFPVWIVVRLCTDEEEVVNFYNDLDSLLELSLDILDDFVGEAEEVHEHNAWLNYALPLHRMREMGYQDRLFDMLDERALTKSELRDFCVLLMGSAASDGLPDPSLDWEGFLRRVDTWLKTRDAGLQWDPIKKKQKPWIDVHKLNSIYGDGSCVIL